jgi:colanic acid biosynthesis glycosyl transferase WcaI
MKLKIVIQTPNFYPELSGIGKYSGELAQWLSARGHKVYVVTAPPYYPEWRVKSGYSKFFWSREFLNGIQIWRCPLWVPITPNGFKRIFHLASFSISSFPVLILHCLYRPHIIFTIEPPLFTAPAALLLSSISRSKSIIHIQDYEVDAAFELGLLKGGYLKSFILKFEKWLLSHFDLVCTISNRMIEKAALKGVKKSKIYFLPNWVNVAEYSTNIDVSNYRKLLNIPELAIVALYSGNMGAKQGLEILGEIAIKYHQNYDGDIPIHFIFCGDGVGKKALIKQCTGLSNVHFLELQPVEDFPKLLSSADIHLLPQRAGIADLVMPSKLTGMLASGRPVLACANPDTELAEVLLDCGLVTPPEDFDSFYGAFNKLVKEKNLRKRLGIAGKDYASLHLDQNTILLKFESKLSELAFLK